MTRGPSIGSYQRTGKNVPVPEIVDRRQKVETPASVLSEGIQEDLKDSIEKTEVTAEKVKSYEEILAEKEIPLDKAHAVIDAMLEKGYYEETIPLKLPASSPVTVTFRTRSHADYLRFLRALEAYAPKYMEEQRELQMRYFLAASIRQFRGHTFRSEPRSNEDQTTLFEERLDWIEKQPERVIHLLASKLALFDMQVQAIMSEGAVENF